MNLDTFRTYCLSFKAVTEEMPFDENTLVFKVLGKMFALADLPDFESINLKCDPEKALELRDQYQCVSAGYHMNKKHWNTIAVNSDMPDNELLKWIDHSYELVVNSLPKKVRATLETL